MAMINFQIKRAPADNRRSQRVPFLGEVYIVRKGSSTLKAKAGNVSENGMFIELEAPEDLQKGSKVEVVIVDRAGADQQIRRLTGIVIRITVKGVALVTYDRTALLEHAKPGLL